MVRSGARKRAHTSSRRRRNEEVDAFEDAFGRDGGADGGANGGGDGDDFQQAFGDGPEENGG